MEEEGLNRSVPPLKPMWHDTFYISTLKTFENIRFPLFFVVACLLDRCFSFIILVSTLHDNSIFQLLVL